MAFKLYRSKIELYLSVIVAVGLAIGYCVLRHYATAKFLPAAVVEENKDRVKFWLAIGANPNRKNEFLAVPIKIDGNEAFTQLGSRRCSCLHLAVFRDNAEIAEDLINKGADVNNKDDEDRTPLFYAALQSKPKLAELLMQRGGDVQVKDKGGNTVLDAAIRAGEKELVKSLLDKGVKFDNNLLLQIPDWIAKEDQEAIHVVHPWDEIFQILVEAGADINVRDSLKNTVLHEACLHAYVDYYSAASRLGRRPSNVGLIEYILSKRVVDVNAVNGSGCTALHYLIESDPELKPVQDLIDAGADPSIRTADKYQQTALDIAKGKLTDAYRSRNQASARRFEQIRDFLAPITH